MEKDGWNEKVDHPLQTWEWGEFKKATGLEVSRVSGFQITWHRIPFTPFTIGYLPKSRLPDSSDLKAIKAEAQKRRALLVRLEPEAIKPRAKTWLRTYTELLKPGRRFFTPQTFVLDLQKSDEELLAAMHPKARYNIRLAAKKGVIIKEDNSPQAFEHYLDLTFDQTAKRQRFYAHNRQYHVKMFEYLHASGLAHLFTATFEGQVIVAWIIFKFKDKLYFPYGASSHSHREVQAPSLMLWETTKWGRAQGCRFYDLWGAEEGKGFNDFKQKFSPQLVEFVGTWDLVINPLLYPIFRLTEEIRWKILHLLK